MLNEYDQMETININKRIDSLSDKSMVSDGYHTFGQLYFHRMGLTAALVSNMDKINPDIKCVKSYLHYDGGGYDGYFVVSINIPGYGQASYHYANQYWPLFKCAVVDKAPEWDGHTPQMAIERIIRSLILDQQEESNTL